MSTDIENNIDQFIFKLEPDEYSINLSPVKEYVKQASTYISKELNVSPNEAVKLVKEGLSRTEINNPIVKYRYKQDNGDRIIKEDKLTDYIKEVLDNNEVLVPSFTSYMHPSKERSLHADFLSINIAKRKQDKANQFKYEQLGDPVKSLHYKTMQNVRKIFNNSLSGAYASASTVLYNPSAHYTLTSITRSVASVGNSITESIVAGNKHFRNPEVIMNYITSIISSCNINGIEYIVNKYNLHKPSVEEVFDTMLYSFKYYWRDPVYEEEILGYLKKLTPVELCAVCYFNDLWHIKRFNPDFVKDLINKMIVKKNDITCDPIYLNKAPEGIDILAKIICGDTIKGKNINYKELEGDPIMWELASTAKNVIDVITEYKTFFRNFFITNVLPPNIAYIKDMLRDTIVLSDTDSTCGSYDKWVEWYYGEIVFTSEAVSIAAAVMTINTQVMDHYLKVFARNMNVAQHLTELIKMKNEYFWKIFVTANVSKHYFANTDIQEGNVYAKPKLELKGVHLIASPAEQSIVARVHNYIKEINGKIVNNEKISLKHYLTAIADLEREIVTKIKAGDIGIFKLDKIKEPGSYKLEKERSPYINHILWEDIFAEKYGSPGDPTYLVIKIPTTINSKKDMEAYLNDMKDIDIKNKFVNFLAKYNKDVLTTFRAPHNIVTTSGIPEELLPIIDYDRIIKDNLGSAYILLESLGFYRGNNTITDLGY